MTNAQAILAGACVIALALYFGLRAQAPGSAPNVEPSDTEATITAPPAAKAADPSAREVPDTAAAPTPDPVPAAIAATLAELERQRPRLIKTCWAPALARAAEPASSRYKLNVTYNAAGEQIAFGMSEVRGYSRPAVTKCLGGAMTALSIPAPGEPVRVELRFSLP